MKSIFPNFAIAWSNNFSKSSIEVASAGTISAPVFSAKLLISPILIAIGALVSTNSAPSSWHLSATFQAIEFSSKAPKIIPFFPFKSPYDIIFRINWLNKK